MCCEIDRLFFRVLENDVAEHGGGCVVHVNDNMLHARYSLERPPYEVLASWRQDLTEPGLVPVVRSTSYFTDLNPHVIRNLVVLYKVSNEEKFGIASSWIRDFYLLETALYQQSEESEFLIHCHGVCEGLVSIAEVGGQPDGSFDKRLGWPCATD